METAVGLLEFLAATGGAKHLQGSVQQSRLSSQFEFQCFNFPQQLNTRKNVSFHLNLNVNLQFWGVQNGFQICHPHLSNDFQI